MCLRVVGLELDGTRQRIQRACVFTGPPERGTEVVLRLEEPGIAFARAFERGDRICGTTQQPVDEAEAVVRNRQARIEADRLGIRPHCGVEVAPRFVLSSEPVVAVRLAARGVLLAGSSSGKRKRDGHPRGVPEHNVILVTPPG
jgi:hypothetical protein